ncbi:hypothetical protein STEG23_013278, partial [Scotinomys teguina]
MSRRTGLCSMTQPGAPQKTLPPPSALDTSGSNALDIKFFKKFPVAHCLKTQFFINFRSSASIIVNPDAQ